MARKKKKRKSFPAAAGAVPTVDTTRKAKAKKQPQGQPIRETVESLVVAFILAFLFRTFQAEAFVIPTGSMAPTLMGRHKDVVCPVSGERFKVNASTEQSDFNQLRDQFPDSLPDDQLRRMAQTVGGVSPSCRYAMPLAPGLPTRAEPEGVDSTASSYSGDRILVNKYIYEFSDPRRWDVVVFKYPGDTGTNYIKRLVGLPNEELRLYQGDLFVRPLGSNESYRVADRSPSKMLAMRQIVHDTDHESATLLNAGWPARWQADDAGSAWESRVAESGLRARQSFAVKSGSDGVQWLRYRHTPPPPEAWLPPRKSRVTLEEIAADRGQPSLITDFNAYNTEVTRYHARRYGVAAVKPQSMGLHWVGDLWLDAEVNLEAAEGDLVLELVEGGVHFRCTLDLAAETASLSAHEFETGDAIEGFAPKASGVLSGAGKHRLRFANVDDKLMLWVDGKAVEFDKPTAYDVDKVFGSREQIVPRTSEADAGDLAPVGIGARGARLTVDRAEVSRDIYYIADTWENPLRGRVNGLPVTDWRVDGNAIAGRFPISTEDGPTWLTDIAFDPSRWAVFSQREAVDFVTEEDQYFVLGDNSGASLDCRLWKSGGQGAGDPGGPYLERKLLIGKAVCVYWPHSWLFPIPNVTDMRLVR
ncbi:MAG: signal peptidase I [Planctomycetota bacterium]